MVFCAIEKSGLFSFQLYRYFKNRDIALNIVIALKYCDKNITIIMGFS